MFNELCFDVCNIVAKNQNIKSLATFVNTCKEASQFKNHMDEKIDKLVASYIHGMVEQIRTFDAQCSQAWKERLTMKVIIDLFNDRPFEDDVINESSRALDYICQIILSQYNNYNVNDVITVWLHIAKRFHQQSTPIAYTDIEKNIMQASVNCIFGTTNRYSVTFGFHGFNSEEQYWMQLSCSMTEKPTIKFIFQDCVDETKDTMWSQEHLDKLNTGLKIDDDGFIEVPMNSTGYDIIAKITTHAMGNKVFINHLAFTPCLQVGFNAYNGKMYSIVKSYVQTHIDEQKINEKLMDVCDYRLYV